MNNPEVVQAVANAEVIERPRYLDKMQRNTSASKYLKIAETLKMLDSTKCLSYSQEEFQKEFGKNGIISMRTYLKKFGILKPRVVKDAGKVYIWSTK